MDIKLQVKLYIFININNKLSTNELQTVYASSKKNPFSELLNPEELKGCKIDFKKNSTFSHEF